MRSFLNNLRYPSALVLALAVAACGGADPAQSARSSSSGSALISAAPSLGSAASFAVLGGPAVTCTGGTIAGDVGVGGPAPRTGFTNTGCTISGTVHDGDAAAIAAYAAFRSAYTEYSKMACPADPKRNLTGTLDGLILSPGTYCVNEVAKTGVLTLNGGGNPNAQWLFLVRAAAGGAGALTGTNFSVVLSNGAVGCNVIWWVEAASAMTTSKLIGTVLAGAAVTLTGGTLKGEVLATAAVTVTGTAVTACAAAGGGGGGGGSCEGEESKRRGHHDSADNGDKSHGDDCEDDEGDNHDHRGNEDGKKGGGD